MREKCIRVVGGGDDMLFGMGTLYREECFCQTNPTEKCGSIVE